MYKTPAGGSSLPFSRRLPVDDAAVEAAQSHNIIDTVCPNFFFWSIKNTVDKIEKKNPTDGNNIINSSPFTPMFVV